MSLSNEEENTEISQQERIAKRLFSFVTIVISAVLAVWAMFFFFVIWTGDYQKTGQIGDSFGIINVLFSGLSISFIAASLILQRLDVNSTLKELKTTAIAQTKQVKLNERMRKESSESLARFFMSSEMRAARNEAWETRRKFLKGILDRELFASIWVDNDEGFGLEEEIKSYATSLLIEYYSLIYHHCMLLDEVEAEKEKLAKMLAHRYLWAYWRGYLLTLADCVKSRYDIYVTNNDGLDAGQLPIPAWIEELKEFDKMSGLPKYDPLTNPFDRKYHLEFIAE